VTDAKVIENNVSQDMRTLRTKLDGQPSNKSKELLEGEIKKPEIALGTKH
jgi:hypothetical protein